MSWSQVLKQNGNYRIGKEKFSLTKAHKMKAPEFGDFLFLDRTGGDY